MLNIDKTGFYKIGKKNGNKINVLSDVYVSLFVKDLSNDLVIDIGKNSKVDFFGFFSKSSPKNIIINQLDGSSLRFGSIFVGSSFELESDIKSQIKGNNSKVNLYVVSIVKESKIGIDSSIKVESGLKDIEARLDLENVFIGKSGTIVSKPNLLVNSDDVKVSHSSKSYRIDELKLFYIRSRGLDESESTKAIIQSYFEKVFFNLKEINKDIFKKTNGEFLSLS